METKVYQAEVKALEDLQVEALISTETRDRGGDILLADGMRIDGKPVVLFAHGQGPMGQEPIAKPLSIQKVDKPKRGILARIQFFSDEVGRRLYEKVKGGFLVNWSVGWRPLKWDYRTEPDGSQTRVVSSWELLELSPVAVGMNPEAQTVFAKSWFKWLASGEAMGREYKALTLPVAKRLEDLLPPRIISELFERHIRCRVVPSLEKGQWAHYNIETDEILLNGSADRQEMAAYYSKTLSAEVEPEAAFLPTIFHEMAHWQERKHLNGIQDSETGRREAEGEANQYAARRFFDWKTDSWCLLDFEAWKKGRA